LLGSEAEETFRLPQIDFQNSAANQSPALAGTPDVLDIGQIEAGYKPKIPKTGRFQPVDFI